MVVAVVVIVVAAAAVIVVVVVTGRGTSCFHPVACTSTRSVDVCMLVVRWEWYRLVSWCVTLW